MRTFKRGIHPAGHKEGSMNEPIREVQPGEELIYPLSQHIGVPATLLVSEGERVLMGQKLAEASAPISASIHSAVSGTVTHIGPHTTMMGELMDAVVVQNDGLYEAVDGFGEEREWRNLNDDEICERVKEAGIVGLGGAGFPTHVKLKPKQPEAIDTLIINGVECEPYLTTDYRLMLEQTEELLTAISIILSLFPHAEAVIAVEDNKPEAIRKLQQATESVERIRVCPLKTKYPQGGERMLIHAVTGRDICSTVLPMDVGCVVENVATVLAIGEAVRYQKPLITRVMTVTGDAVTSPCNVRVSIGDNYRHILEAAGGCKAEPRKIVSGGPMTGIALFDLDIPIIKTSASILALL